MSHHFDSYYDARGLICPMPVLKAHKALRDLSAGQILKLQTDDPVAVIDVPHFCVEHGYSLLSQEITDAQSTFYILA